MRTEDHVTATSYSGWFTHPLVVGVGEYEEQELQRWMLEEIVFKGRETCWVGESGGEK